LAEPFTYEGACHCGAIRASLRSMQPAHEIQVRACQCGFCTRHGAMTVSDAGGSAVFHIENGRLVKYQFATRSGTVLLCATCGTYAGVIVEADERIWSVANVRGLAIPEFQGARAEPVVYDGETVERRIARRKQMWTPTQVHMREIPSPHGDRHEAEP
jgi:hypothetical protein